MKYSVSILCLNNYALTKRCVASVLEHSGVDCEVLLTNNGSTDRTRAFMDSIAASHSRVRVFHNERNEGFIAPNLQRLKDARGQFFILLNNDTTVPTGWLETLEHPFKKFPKCALSGHDQGCCSLEDSFHGTCGERLEYIEGSLVMGRTEFLRTIGLFSPELHGAYGEDSDLSLRVREMGFTIHRVKLAIFHQRAATSMAVPQAREWQAKNHEWLRKRWKHYLKVRKFDYPILIKRRAAWGDVLLVTPIIAALKAAKPQSPIWVETDCREVFRGNPHVARCDLKIPVTFDAMVIDLNMSYEARTQTHIVDAYADAAKLPRQEWRTELYPSEVDSNWANNVASGDKWIAINPGPTLWRSKNWPQERFADLTGKLLTEGYKVALVGHHVPSTLIPCTADLGGKTTLHQLAAVLASCRCFIGVDSFPLHVAQAMGIPAVGLFGITDPKFILTSGSPSIGVCGSGPSFGQRHREIGKQVVDDAGAAINTISVEQVLEATTALIEETILEGTAP